MRKSGRLASIHDDDDDINSKTTDLSLSGSNESVSSSDSKISINTKKFTPTIPTIRRKKVVEEVPEAEASTNTKQYNAANTRRGPLNSSRQQPQQPAIVSGPLSLGPAAMARSSRPSSGSAPSGAGIFRGGSRISTATMPSGSSSSMLDDTIPIDCAFQNAENENTSSSNNILKPIALGVSSEKELLESGFRRNFVEDFDPEQLYLFQLPPVLPSIVNHQPAPVSFTDTSEKWPLTAQGRYGRMRRYKSGKITLVLENGIEFLVNQSIQSSSEAQMTSVLVIDPEFSQSFNLGPIRDKFVCSPDFEKFQK